MKRFSVLLLFMVALLLPSCIFCTANSMTECFRYQPEPVRSKDVWAPCCYRVGDACYLPVSVAFVSSGYYSLWVYLPRLDETSIPMDSSCKAVETYYYRLSAADAKLLTGLRLPEVPAEAPAYVEGEDWDASAAVAVPLRKPLHSIKNSWYATHSLKLEVEPTGKIVASVPMPPLRTSPVGFIKWPLAAALFVGVDIPGTVVSSVLLSPLLILDATL